MAASCETSSLPLDGEGTARVVTEGCKQLWQVHLLKFFENHELWDWKNDRSIPAWKTTNQSATAEPCLKLKLIAHATTATTATATTTPTTDSCSYSTFFLLPGLYFHLPGPVPIGLSEASRPCPFGHSSRTTTLDILLADASLSLCWSTPRYCQSLPGGLEGLEGQNKKKALTAMKPHVYHNRKCRSVLRAPP